MQATVTFCDNCGQAVWYEDPINQRANIDVGHKVYSEVPFNVASANKGESAVVCDECDEQLTADMEDAEG